MELIALWATITIAIHLAQKHHYHSKLHKHVKVEYIRCGDIDTLLCEEWTIQQQFSIKNLGIPLSDSLEEKHPTGQPGYFKTILDTSYPQTVHYVLFHQLESKGLYPLLASQLIALNSNPRIHQIGMSKIIHHVISKDIIRLLASIFKKL